MTLNTVLTNKEGTPLAPATTAEQVAYDNSMNVKQAIDSRISDAEYEVINQRINNLAKLPEGSTTGDAELSDIRIGYDGTPYETAGESVRSQCNDLSHKIDDGFGQLNIIFDKNVNNYEISKVLLKDGTVTDGPSNYIVSNYIECQLFSVVFLKSIYFGDPSAYLQVAFYDSEFNFLSGHTVSSSGTTTDDAVEIPNLALYFKFSCESSKWDIRLKYLRIATDDTLTKNMPANSKFIGEILNTTYKIYDESVLSIPNKYIQSNGIITDINAPQYHISEYINCTTFRKMVIKETYLAKGNALIAFYDKLKTFVGSVISGGDLQKDVIVNVPKDAFYMVLSSNIIDSDYKLYITEVGIESNKHNLVSILNNKRVTFIGDSITAGQGSSTYVSWIEEKDGVTHVYRGNAPDYPYADNEYEVGEHLLTEGTWNWYESLSANGWAQKLKKYLIEKFNCTVHNRACAGINSTTVRNNFDRWSEDSDIIFIMIGTNDRGDNDLTTFSQNVSYVVRTLLSESKIPILISSIPAKVGNETIDTMKYHMEDVDIEINKIATAYGITYYSFFNNIQKYCDQKNIPFDSLLTDELHPNDDGYNVMYRLLCYGLNIPLKIENSSW
ncbi:MAG TPA: SGNH/GDSL hydrolase family protein [Candidatus Anaerobutyricum stercoris]|uniref:SGNH/GDSL hydrolase family protein n=1 Tax=Candidatus Anaerobutyricum stercoris TaxID=2838457 RepID=A0A9D2EJW1_9FIRM|nr:SGNH/GDSL hydrolase family protein [Candidatus Anaerobutyricum stercoris]